MRENSICGIEEGKRLATGAAGGLACSCKPQDDRIELSAPWRGIERIAARFHGNGFSPHRHDTYALGITVSGVQAFRYRTKCMTAPPGRRTGSSTGCFICRRI
ncbi:hypothetical protein ABID21_002054 [Pseudorhizobium tarimense]|uniref:AraC-type arabinose-binding/dimerisation domain-containing protein n=1 Tax=Pseudorhizobium tarimense TaxID=1079109 RepID=A0ABV2H684_9HYPH